MTTAASLRYLPWVRQGAAAEIADDGTLETRITVNGSEIAMPMRVMGPGMVTGIDPKQVIRMEPRPGTVDFNPFQFPTIEFDRPDFPWLFTPARPDAQGRLRPWLCLVVVRQQEGVALRFGTPLPVLEIAPPAQPTHELPDLAESWAWAHAQVAGPAGAASPIDGLADPSRNLSRLMCPRKLEGDADYIACVVPAFEAGRLAGLGQPDTGVASSTPAWSSSDPQLQPIALPVYHQWEFRTGPPVDFESLVRLLKARPLSKEAGRRRVYIGQAGSGLPALLPDAPGAVLLLEGALTHLDSTPSEWPAAPRTALQTKLRALLNAPADALAQGATDPVVAPPIYGRWHAATDRVALTNGQPPWLHELNLDPRHRAAAGLGAEVVRRDQESLMAAAWEQVGDIVRANELLKQAQLARSVTGSLHERHFSLMPEDTLVRMTGTALGSLRAVSVPNEAPPPITLTLKSQVARSTMSDVAASPTLRRLARPRGPVMKRSVAMSGALRGAAGADPSTTLAVTTRSVATSGIVTIEGVSEMAFAAQPELRARVRTFGASPASFNPQAPAGYVWTFTLQAEGAPLIDGHWERRRVGDPDTGHRPVFLNFRAAAAEHEARLPRPGDVGFTRRSVLGELRNGLLAALDPAVTIPTLVRSRIRMASAPAALATRDDALEPIMAAPDFPRPMYEALRDLSSDYLLPGLEHVPPNTVAALQTNQAFVEAFMAGLSTEMARELLWREFPTDQRGTYFRQFWAVADLADARQIRPMHQWNTTLGQHPEPGLRHASFVLLIRGELLRRYPHTVIFAAKAATSGGRRVPSPVERYPIFRGSLEPDVTFLGFDLSRTDALGTATDPGWFFVIQEQPTAPRFGLDQPTGFAGTIATPAKWSDLSWGHLAVDQAAFDRLTHVPVTGPLPDTSTIRQPPGVAWGESSAHMAFATAQQPVRIAIHARDLISAPETPA